MELKACPFCGSDLVEFAPDEDQQLENTISGFIWCHRCGFSSDSFYSEAIATEKWNRRAAPENKELTVTLPCNIGDRVYEIEDELPIIAYCVTGFVLGKTEFEDEDDIEERQGWQVEYGKSGIACERPISEFGKSLFLTHKEAEQALAARRPEAPK